MSSIQKLLAGYRSGELNAATVFETAVSLARAGKSDGNNEWIYVITPEEQSAQLAKLSDIDAPLYGIPFAVKDNIDVEGVPTTAACPEFAYTATTNAICVQRLLDAGALFVGKTNLDQFATGTLHILLALDDSMLTGLQVLLVHAHRTALSPVRYQQSMLVAVLLREVQQWYRVELYLSHLVLIQQGLVVYPLHSME